MTNDFCAALPKCSCYTAVAVCLFIVTSMPMISTFLRYWTKQEPAENDDDPYHLDYEDYMPKNKTIRFPERFLDIRIDDDSNSVAAHFMKEIFCEIGADKNVRMITANKICYSLQQSFSSMDSQHCETSLRVGWRRLANKCVPAAKTLPSGTDSDSELVMKGLCQVVTHHTKVLRTSLLEVFCPVKPNGKTKRECRESFDSSWVDVIHKCIEFWKTDDDWLQVAREKAAKAALATKTAGEL